MTCETTTSLESKERHTKRVFMRAADTTAFTGDVLDRIKERIQAARFLVADLSGANPNVYLELGFAWGCGTPTVLVCDTQSTLKFDVQGQLHPLQEDRRPEKATSQGAWRTSPSERLTDEKSLLLRR